MLLPREEISVQPQEVFGDIPAVVVGGVATRAYAPEPHTKDIDFLIPEERYAEAVSHLAANGWQKVETVFFPNTSLGLYAEAWIKDDVSIDVISSAREWANEALQTSSFDQIGLPVVSLPFLVLMKIESARGIDQGDLTRMLGRLNEEEVESIAAAVQKYSPDADAAEDVRQYAVLGRMEWQHGPG